MDNRLTERIREIQTQMVESVKSCFDDSELDHLRAVIRIAVEFRNYLQYGSVETAGGLYKSPQSKYFRDLEAASADPFNKYDLEVVCKSIRSGIDSFWSLNASYRILAGARGSNIKWGITLSRESFREQFISMFDKFASESVFENKCRLLLDLFKLQIIFLGFSYE